MSTEQEKVMIYFHKGEIVRIKQEIPCRPDMVVKKVAKAYLNENDNQAFLGVVCFWFDTNYRYCEQLFNSKDLEKC